MIYRITYQTKNGQDWTEIDASSENGIPKLLNATPEEAVNEIKNMGIDFARPAIVKL